MKALKEIGIKKSLKFGVMTIFMIIYKLMLFPQLRVIYLRLLGVKIGENTIIHEVKFFNLYRRGLGGLTIGNNCFVGDDCLIDLADEVTISDNVTLAERITILTHTNVGFKDHPLQKYFPPVTDKVVIKEGSFIGANTVILPGITINENVFVAAGSVVTKNLPRKIVIGGVPARIIRRIDT